MKLSRKIHILYGFILTILMAFTLTGCEFSNNSNDTNVFKVGMECSYAPFNWLQPNSKGDAVEIAGGWFACGYDVYIASKLAEAMNKKLEIVKIDWEGLLPALTSGKIDAIIAAMSATEDRRKAIDFTDKYYTSKVVVVMKKGSKYESSKSIRDFSGARITAQLGTIHYKLIDQMPGVLKQVATDDFSSTIASLNAGKIDCYVSEKATALTTIHANPNLMYIEFNDENGFKLSKDEIEVRIGVKKGNRLLNEINEALKSIDENTRKQLMEKAVKNSCA